MKPQKLTWPTCLASQMKTRTDEGPGACLLDSSDAHLLQPLDFTISICVITSNYLFRIESAGVKCGVSV